MSLYIYIYIYIYIKTKSVPRIAFFLVQTYSILNCWFSIHAGVEHVGGNMFDNVPRGDAIILKVVFLIMFFVLFYIFIYCLLKKSTTHIRHKFYFWHYLGRKHHFGFFVLPLKTDLITSPCGSQSIN